MSAICGIIQLDKAPNAANRCNTIQAALEPYGRHAQGLWDGQHVALGSRLTRLLPEDQYDHQPLQGGNGRFVLIADVRLDNRTELGHKLGIPLSRLQAMADADVLLAAYEQWEQQLLSHLVGDFAFAVWDKQQQSLFLARDHMGNTPLFYHHGDRWFGFASMPASFFALPEVAMAPAEDRIRDTLFLLPDMSSNSYFAGIHRLLPGHWATLQRDGTFSSKRYWSVPTEERIYFKSDDDYVDAFQEKLEEAVRCRLRSTGSVASQLSAGFDSSTVTSIAARLLAHTGQSLHTYTSVPNPDGLPDSGKIMDEGPLAAQVAAIFPNIHHHLIRTDDQSITSMLDTMFKIYNRPIKNVVNQLWTMAIDQQAAEKGATTLLTGTMGNATISYNGEQVLNALLREGQFVELLRQLRHQFHKASNRSRLGALYRTLVPSLPDKLQQLLEKVIKPNNIYMLMTNGLNQDFLASSNFQEYCRQQGNKLDRISPWLESRLWRKKWLQKLDIAEFRKGNLGFSNIDKRDPTADIRLIQYCQAIPVEQFNKNGFNSWLLRRYLQRLWPAEIIASRVRGKQGADIQYRIKRELTSLFHEVALLKNEQLARELINLELLQSQLTQYTGTPNQFVRDFDLLRIIAAGHFIRMTSK